MDAVVTWLDTTDKNYIKQRNKDFGSSEPYNIHRVGKRDELRFCLRSLYYNTPWLRRIYLITWENQFPDWLDEKVCSEHKPPIIKIKRESLNNGNYIYGSIAVESVLYKIPDLSDLFLYSNCDLFITKKMVLSDWVDSSGNGKLQSAGIIESFEPRPDSWWNSDILSQIELFLKFFGKPKFDFFCRTHHITILSKKAYTDVFKTMPKLLEQTTMLKGRELVDRITRTLLEFVSVHNGYCKINETIFPSVLLNEESDYTNYKLPKDTALLCTNLNSKILKVDYGEYIRFMVNLFPQPLPGEKYLNYEDVCYYRYTDCVKECLNKSILSVDNLKLIPKNTKKNMSARLRLTRKLNTLKKNQNKNKSKNVSGN